MVLLRPEAGSRPNVESANEIDESGLVDRLKGAWSASIGATYGNLVAARLRAEQVATKSRSQRILSRLGNSKVRQPLLSFQVADLVKVRRSQRSMWWHEEK